MEEKRGFLFHFCFEKGEPSERDAMCRAIVVFDGCSGPFCYSISGRNAIEQVSIGISYGITNVVTA